MKWVLALLAAGMLVMQARLAGRFSFHEDEALYTSFSQDIRHGDIFLTAKGLDKPPVFFYLQALSFRLLGESPLTARLPNMLAMVAAFLLTCRLVRRVYGDGPALYVALLAAFSPLLMLHGPTAFVDPIAVCFAMASLERLSARRYLAAGLLGALAVFSKQYFGIYLLFEAVLMAFIPSLKPSAEERRAWIKGVVLTSLPFLLWATFANTPAWYILKNAGTTYDRWGQSSLTLFQSLGAWIQLYGVIFAVPGAVVVLILGLRMDRSEESRWDTAWFVFVLGCFLMLALQVRIPHWHRYVLLVALPACILAGRGLWLLIRWAPKPAQWALAAVLLASGVHSANRVWAATPPYDFGANYSGNDGIRELLLAAPDKIPARGVLFIDFSTFLRRLYARSTAFPILPTETASEVLTRIQEFPFSRLYLMDRRDHRATLLPAPLASLVEVVPIDTQGAYEFVELRPKPGRKVSLHHPEAKKRLAELGITIKEDHPGRLLVAGQAHHHIPYTAECSVKQAQAFCETGGLCVFEGEISGCSAAIDVQAAAQALLANNRKTFRSLDLAMRPDGRLDVRAVLHFLKIPLHATVKAPLQKIGLPEWLSPLDRIRLISN